MLCLIGGKRGKCCRIDIKYHVRLMEIEEKNDSW